MRNRREQTDLRYWLIRLLGGALTLFAILALAVGMLPFSMVRAMADRAATDGQAEFYTPDIHGTVRQFCFLVSIISFAGIVCLVRFGTLLQHTLEELFADARKVFQEAWRQTESHPRMVLIILAITVLGCVIRLPYLTQPVRYDESYTYMNFVVQPWYFPVVRYVAPNNHVLHSLLANFSCSVFGDSLWALRLPAFIAGVLLIPATAVLALVLRRSAAVAICGSLLIAFSTPFVDYSTNARGYSLLCQLLLLGVCLAWSVVSRGNRISWTCLPIVMAFAAWCIPIAVYYCASLTCWLLFAPWQLRIVVDRYYYRRLAIALLSAAVLTVGLYSPMFAVDGFSAISANRFVHPLSIQEVVAGLPTLLHATYMQWMQDVPLGGQILLLAGALGTGIISFRRSRHAAVGSLLLLPFALIPVFLVLQRVLGFPRLWLPLLPSFYLASLMGLRDGLQRVIPKYTDFIFSIVVLWISAAQWYSTTMQGTARTSELPEAQTLSEMLCEDATTEVVILANWPGDYCLRYYVYHRCPRLLEQMPSPGFAAEIDQRRVWVILNRRWKDSISSVLAEFQAQSLLQTHRETQTRNVDQVQILVFDPIDGTNGIAP